MGVSQFMKQEVNRLREENEELREEVIVLRQYIDAIQALMEAVDSLDPNAEIMPLLGQILYSAQTVINAAEGSLLVLDEDTSELVFVLVRGTAGQQLMGHRMPADKGIAGWVVKNRKPTIVNNTRTDDRFYSGIDQKIQFQTNSILAAPIVGSGKVLGVLEVLNKRNGQPFNETDQTLLVLLCKFAGEVLFRMTENGTPEAPNTEAGPPIE